MQKVIINGTRSVSLIEVPTPKAVKDWALVKIQSIPMCTEYKDYVTGKQSEFLGHEAAGEVVAVDKDALVEVGDRVVVMPQYPCGSCPECTQGDYIHCRSVRDVKQATGEAEGSATYAQYVLKPSWLLPKIPDDMSYEHASMLCCGLGPAFGALQRMKVNDHDTVLITGMGPVGLGAVICAKHRCARVIAVAHHGYRAGLAQELGAEIIIDDGYVDVSAKLQRLTEGRGVDTAIECAGTQKAQRVCIENVRRLGQVSFVGESGELPIAVSDDLIRNGLTLHGVWHYNQKDIPELFKVAANRGWDLDKLITHNFPMSRVKDAFELQIQRQCGKVILYPWKD